MADLEEIKETVLGRIDYGTDVSLFSDIWVLLRDYPQIVRCKDCKHRYDSIRCPIALIADLLKDTKVFEYKVNDDWFCADGVKRDE